MCMCLLSGKDESPVSLSEIDHGYQGCLRLGANLKCPKNIDAGTFFRFLCPFWISHPLHPLICLCSCHSEDRSLECMKAICVNLDCWKDFDIGQSPQVWNFFPYFPESEMKFLEQRYSRLAVEGGNYGHKSFSQQVFLSLAPMSFHRHESWFYF